MKPQATPTDADRVDAGEHAAAASLPANPASGAEFGAAQRSEFQRSSTALERWLLRRFFQVCGSPAVRILLWDGAAFGVAPERSIGEVVIRDRATLWGLLLDSDLAFGDAFSDGTMEVRGPLIKVFAEIFRAIHNAPVGGAFGKALSALRRRRSHSIASSRRSIHDHYDIGNEFYRLWLDDRMQYTCAYYATPATTLAEAQLAKLEHVCRKLQLRAGQTVLEAGCGWGGLAIHMADRYGVAVRAFNLSHEQVEFSRRQAEAAGLSRRIEFVEDDYRNATGKYDAFVSVGMLEHVGVENYTDLGRVIDRVLTPDGRGLIHSIGRNAPQPLDPWTEKRIFPGGYPPSLKEMMGIFEPVGLSVLDVENLRLHYARTLEHWLERFERVAANVREMFDERFVGMWRMYLSGSAATFRAGGLQLFQVVFARGASNDIPWTREHLYSVPE
jgi:cyclopropane-fatty-acyl-phospholipid synthase